MSRILVVDDDDAVRVVTSEMLTSLGYQVETVDGGRAALDRLQAEHFDAVLLDVGMPVMSGVDVYVALKEMHSQQNVVFMTGYTDEEISDFRNEHTWVLTKPFSMQGLSELIQTVC